MTRFSPKTFIRELRRRRVFNTVVIYIVGAWVTLQVTELALPALDIPDRAIRYVWLGAFLLLPLVLVFAWRYDISTHGIRRTAKAGEEQAKSLGRPDQLIVGVFTTIAIIVTGAMGYRISQVEEPSPMAIPENSIAVMPFGVCEERTSDLPLASGLTGEVINRLARRDRLKITGRTTTFNIAGVGVSTQQVSQLLGTQYVLFGTLCRDGLNLTLEAELQDKDGFIKWRDIFKEVTNEYDQVEQRLASMVSNGVALELGDVTREASAKPVKRQALEQFLIGKEYARQNDKDKACAAYEKALEFQPDFAEATMELALWDIRTAGALNIGPAIEKAYPMAERALTQAKSELDHGMPDFNAHRVVGRILINLARMEQNLLWREAAELSETEIAQAKAAARARLSEAEQHFRSAIALNPSDGDLYAWLAWSLDLQGIDRGAEALDVLQQGMELDPFNSDNARDLANRLAARGQFRQAMEVLDRFNALPVEKRRPLYFIRLEILNNLGRFDEKLAAIVDILETDPEEAAATHTVVVSHLLWEVSQIVRLGLDEEAAALYRQVDQIPYGEKGAYDHALFLEEFYLQATNKEEAAARRLEKIAGKTDEEILDGWSPEVGNTVWALWQAGEKERAIRLQEALIHDQYSPDWIERQFGAAFQLAWRYMDVGREDEGLALLTGVAEGLEEQVDAGIRHPQTLGMLANIYVLMGNDGAAVEMFDLAVDYGYWNLLLEMENPSSDPKSDWWGRFMENPSFVRSVNRMRSIRDQQAANVRSLLTQYDMDNLLAPLIEMRAAALAEEQEDS